MRDEEDVDALDGRRESADQRSDRNWDELLQETRIVQTGTQILSGFLLTIVFQPRFDTLTAFQHGLYLVLVLLSTLTTALAMSSVVLHRLLMSALCGLGLTMTGTVLLVFDVAVGARGGAVAAVGVVVLLVVLTLVPTAQALRARRG